MPRIWQLTYCKILHGILSTNTQNPKFYNHSTLCPHSDENFMHVLQCPHPEVVEFCQDSQTIMWRARANSDPPTLLSYLKSGIVFGSLPIDDGHTINTSLSGTQHSILSWLSTLKEASLIGWENLYRGRLSKLCGEACYQESLTYHYYINSQLWAVNLIQSLLQYSHSLWKFRCKLLHGRTETEAHQRLVLQLQDQVTQAYQAFHKDPHVVRASIRYTFHTPLEYRLHRDVDGLQCFIVTYRLGTKEQALHQQRHMVNAQWFFFPISLPTTIQLQSSNDMSSSVSTCPLKSKPWKWSHLPQKVV